LQPVFFYLVHKFSKYKGHFFGTLLAIYISRPQQGRGEIVAKLGVIADDITGANDTAVQFAKHNISSFVRLDFDKTELSQDTADVVVVDTDSRDIAPEQAYQTVLKVCQALLQSGVESIYKKVDSTLRGNLGAEIAATVKALQPEIVVIAPAFPANNRITVGGYHLLNQMPIELTEIAHAPKSPVNESRIVELLKQQTAEKIGLIDLSTVINGAAAIKIAIESCVEQGEKWIVFDAVQDEHLASIATAAHGYANVLWVGSAGLAEQLPRFYEWQEKSAGKVEAAQGAVVIIAGSVSKITQQQIRQVLNLPNIHLIKINGANLTNNQAEEIKRCISEAKAFIEEGKDILLASAITDEDVALAVAAGQKKGLTSVEVSEQTAAALGKVAEGLAACALSGMVLTGGDTAIHVCRALGAAAIEIIEEVAVGIPLGHMVGGKLDGLRVVTKAGAFGSEESLVLAIKAIRL
jgi:uncharacterized protein YgbK (DUF1537 family)